MPQTISDFTIGCIFWTTIFCNHYISTHIINGYPNKITTIDNQWYLCKDIRQHIWDISTKIYCHNCQKTYQQMEIFLSVL